MVHFSGDLTGGKKYWVKLIILKTIWSNDKFKSNCKWGNNTLLMISIFPKPSEDAFCFYTQPQYLPDQ